MSVGEMLGRMSSREIGEWLAYFQLEAEDYEQRQRVAKASGGVRSRKGRRRGR